MDLSTHYLGLTLKNPVVAGASAMTAKKELIERIAKAGAGAVVAQSLFEEQIQLDRFHLDEEAEAAAHRHPEMETVFPRLAEAGPEQHLAWLREVKQAIDIPLIGSINAVQDETWVEYAAKVADTGVDALELNFYSGSRNTEQNAAEIEDRQIRVVERICGEVSLPVSVKLSVFYTNPLQVIRRFMDAGAAGAVLFNAFFHPDFDIEQEKNTLPVSFSKPQDIRLRLRFAGLLHDTVDGSICVSGGVHYAPEVIKAILAGADAVQMVSSLYLNKPEHLQTVLTDLQKWMEQKGHNSLDEFRGKLSQKNNPDRWTYSRMQYVGTLLKPDPLSPPDHALRSI
ncbi:MAG: dihydroorotate dehydrogenase-like protein [Verrucomicrobiota bacterium]